jgi:hypothetical protein
MTYFADLTAYSYLPRHADGSVNVGWLGPDQGYPAGQVAGEVVTAVLRLVRSDPVNRTRGLHDCELCVNPPRPIIMAADGAEIVLGNCEIRVQGSGPVVYAAPSLLAHYLAGHRYLPPRSFIDAVLDR